MIEAVEGERLRILVKSGDGLHGFEIKKFKVSKEIPRGGEPVVIEFTARRGRQVSDSLFRVLRRRPRRHEGHARRPGRVTRTLNDST